MWATAHEARDVKCMARHGGARRWRRGKLDGMPEAQGGGDGGAARDMAEKDRARRRVKKSRWCGRWRSAMFLGANLFLQHSCRIGEAANPGPAEEEDELGFRTSDDPRIGGLPVVTGNGSGWGSIYAWLPNCQHDVMCVQEHKLGHPEDLAAASTNARERGWKSFWTQAVPSLHEAEAPSGGTAVLVRNSLGALEPPGGADVYPGHCSAALVEAGGIGGVVFYSVYLRCGSELDAFNWGVLCRIAQHIKCHGRPWAVCGDWNVTPATLAASGWAEKLDGTIIVLPASHTTTISGRLGRLIDYVVVCKPMASIGIRAQVDGTAPIRTHSAVSFVAPARPRSFMTTVMRAARKAPTVKPIGPRKSPADATAVIEIARKATKLAEEGNVAEAVETRELAVKGWLEFVEGEMIKEYHLDELDGGAAPFRGRAAGPSFVREPLLGTNRHRRHPAAGAENRRLRLVQDRAGELMAAAGRLQTRPDGDELIERARAAIAAGHHAGHAAPRGSDSGGVARRLKGVAKKAEKDLVAHRRGGREGPAPDAEGILRAATAVHEEAKRAADAREAEHVKEIRQSVADWCREAEANGAGRAHRWAKVLEAWRPESVEAKLGNFVTRTSNPDDLVKQERAKWSALWAPTSAERHLPEWGTVPRLPRPTVREVRAAARRFRRGTGQGADRINPRDLGDLDDQNLELVIELMTCCEVLGSVPGALALVVVVLIQKNGGAAASRPPPRDLPPLGQGEAAPRATLGTAVGPPLHGGGPWQIHRRHCVAPRFTCRVC